jgi:hypothetical protein
MVIGFLRLLMLETGCDCAVATREHAGRAHRQCRAGSTRRVRSVVAFERRTWPCAPVRHSPWVARRVEHDRPPEFAECPARITRISRFRLEAPVAR